MQSSMLRTVLLIVGIVAAIAMIILLTVPSDNSSGTSSISPVASQDQGQPGADDRKPAQDAPTTQPTTKPAAPGAVDPRKENPAGSFFDHLGSDPEAVALADLTMRRMGGRPAWDEMRYVTWNFRIANRRHIWDKHRNVVRIEHIDPHPDDPTQQATGVFLLDLDRFTGRYWIAGREVLDPEELSQKMQDAYRLWANDSYWLFMPYKLKDTGVTLRYLGQSEMINDRGLADVLEVTFRGVGVTPHNRYHVYISRETGLVEQWDFYPTVDAEDPRFQQGWLAWARHGRIMLSSMRQTIELADIAVFDDLPEWIWESGEQLNMRELLEFVSKAEHPEDPRYRPGPIDIDLNEVEQ